MSRLLAYTRVGSESSRKPAVFNISYEHLGFPPLEWELDFIERLAHHFKESGRLLKNRTKTINYEQNERQGD